MRKILMATTALIGVALAGVAQAAPSSPISLNVGGYTDFVAGFFHEADGTTPTMRRAGKDFETEFKLNFDAVGKGTNGIEYGANVSLWNGAEATDSRPFGGGTNTVRVNSAYVWMSGAFGKALLGDEHGASDLFVYAPTVGEGQVDGRYRDFVDIRTLSFFQASGIDNTEHSTKVTYYTPKVGNENHKVQLGVSYAPNMYDYGQSATLYTDSSKTSPYEDIVKAALSYTGNIRPVTVAASAQIIAGSASHVTVGNPAVASNVTLMREAGRSTVIAGTAKAQDFTSWGLGTQVGYNGFTVGGSYVNMGRYNTVHEQNRNQETWSVGGKYEFDKAAVAINYLNGEGYNNALIGGSSALTVNGTNYVKDFNAYGAGATYTWFPGLTSAVDGVMFQQRTADNATDTKNDGYVVLLSQKLAF